MNKVLILLKYLMISITISSITYADYMGDISDAFDDLTDKYEEITEDVQDRLEDELSKDAQEIAGEGRTNVYLTEAQIAHINSNTREAGKTLTRDIGNTVTNLAELSAQIQELDLIVTEVSIATNELMSKKATEQWIKKNNKNNTKDNQQ